MFKEKKSYHDFNNTVFCDVIVKMSIHIIVLVMVLLVLYFKESKSEDSVSKRCNPKNYKLIEESFLLEIFSRIKYKLMK